MATQAVLSVLGERISEKEARDLASELPRELKRMLENVRGHSRGFLARESSCGWWLSAKACWKLMLASTPGQC